MKILRNLFFTLLVLLLLVGGGVYYVLKNYATVEYAELRINQFLDEYTDKSYSAILGGLDYDFPARSIRLDSVQITYNSPSDFPEISGSIRHLAVQNISIRKLFGSKFYIKRFEIEEPDLTINWSELPELPQTDSTATAFRGQEILLNNGRIALGYNNKDYDIQSFSVRVDDFDFSGAEDFSDIFTQAAHFRLTNFEMVYDDHPKNLSFSELDYSSIENQLIVKELGITPLTEYQNFFAALEFRKDHITAGFAEFIINQPDISRLIRDNEIRASSVAIDGLDFRFIRDYRIPPHPDMPISPMPSEFLHSLGMKIHIPEIKVTNSFFEYGEFEKSGMRPGFVNFNNSEITISKLFYDPDKDDETEFTSFDIKTDIKDHIPLTAQMKMKLINEENYVEATGFISDADATIFSDVAEALAGVQIISANVDSLRFDVIIMDQKAEGWVMLRYRDAEIKIVQKTDGERGLRERFATFSASAFVLRSNNYEPNPWKGRGEVSYENEEGDSFLRFLWRSIRDGIFDTTLRIR